MEEREFWVAFWKIMGAVLVVISLTIAGCDSYQTKLFIDKGYTRQVLPGQSGTSWVK